MADDIKVVGLASSKNKGKPNWKIISAIIGIIVLSVGVIAGILLVRQNQDIREKAAECNQGGFACPDPSNPNLLRDCSTGETFPNDSLCNFAGRVEVCGSNSATAKQYCCPVAGGAWTADLTGCASAGCDAKIPTDINATQITGSTAKLSWTGGSGGKLRLWVSTDPNPTGTCGTAPNTCILNDKELTITTKEYELTGLKPNTKYYYRLMAWTKEGCDSGSAVLSFTTNADSASSATPTATATSGSVSTATATSIGKTATPTVTSTSKATATSTSKTATPTAKSTASGSGTPFPVPETGADIPTVLGLSFGVVMILISLGLAL